MELSTLEVLLNGNETLWTAGRNYQDVYWRYRAVDVPEQQDPYQV